MKARLFEQTVLSDVPPGSYRVIGDGDFKSLGKKGSRFVIMVGRNGYNPTVKIPEKMTLCEKVEIKEEIVNGRKRFCCVVTGSKRKAKDGYTLIKVCPGPRGTPAPWDKTIKYFYANRKWTLFQIDERKY